MAGRTAGQRPGTQSFRSPGTAPAHHHSDPTEMTKPVILGNCQLHILKLCRSGYPLRNKNSLFRSLPKFYLIHRKNLQFLEKPGYFLHDLASWYLNRI